MGVIPKLNDKWYRMFDHDKVLHVINGHVSLAVGVSPKHKL